VISRSDQSALLSPSRAQERNRASIASIIALLRLSTAALSAWRHAVGWRTRPDRRSVSCCGHCFNSRACSASRGLSEQAKQSYLLAL
jgi:hypothetical protein